MGSHGQIYSPTGRLGLDVEVLAVAADQWGASEVLHDPQDEYVDVTIRFQRPGESFWQIFHDVDDRVIWTDGSGGQELDFAVKIRELIRPDVPLVLLDGDATVAARLEPGMTADQVLEAWTEPPGW